MAKTRRRQLLFHQDLNDAIEKIAKKEFKSFTGMLEHMAQEYIKNHSK